MHALSRPWFTAVVLTWIAVGVAAIFYASQQRDRARNEQRADAVRDAAYPANLLHEHAGVKPVTFRFDPPPLAAPRQESAPGTVAPLRKARPVPLIERTPNADPLTLPTEGQTPASGLSPSTPSSRRSASGLQAPQPAPILPSYAGYRPARESEIAPLAPPANEGPAITPPGMNVPPSQERGPSGSGAGIPYVYPTTGASQPLPMQSVLVKEPSRSAASEEPVRPSSPRDVAPRETAPRVMAVRPISAEAMKIVNARAHEFNRSGFSLAERSAFFSARADFIQALRLIAQAIDAQAGGVLASQSLSNGLRALEEAEDFRPKGSRLEADLDTSALADGHRTPVLKEDGVNADQVSALRAVQMYYAYAQEQLAASCGGQAAGSVALYGMGKIQLSLAKAEGEVQGSHGPQAMAYFQAAMMADPSNQRASNELGVMLGRYGQWADARTVLLQSLSVRPMPETWHNLAVVHDRLNEPELARKARHEYELARQTTPSSSTSVQWLDSKTFAQTNPGPSGPPLTRATTAAKPPQVDPPQKSSWWLPWQR
ncbi:hypothetical protein [Lignipirellula cremea]|uniref:Uncharacterized protein n=1 Tax=Lignipirellula cremea TaxID=2528010 RepID=A0A518DZ29_9BACT|nr:hypothetical protein [Lignipirellula cremea]QDU97084.1 hypothetical protein Pla8534_49100 [Lignipirellula cremea]